MHLKVSNDHKCPTQLYVLPQNLFCGVSPNAEHQRPLDFAVTWFWFFTLPIEMASDFATCFGKWAMITNADTTLPSASESLLWGADAEHPIRSISLKRRLCKHTLYCGWLWHCLVVLEVRNWEMRPLYHAYALLVKRVYRSPWKRVNGLMLHIIGNFDF